MARKFLLTFIALKALLHLFLLTTTIRNANAARLLVEKEEPAVVPTEAPVPLTPDDAPEDKLPEPVKGPAATVAAPAAAAAIKPAKAAKADATPDYAPEDKHPEHVKGPAATVAVPAAAAAIKPAKAAKADATPDDVPEDKHPEPVKGPAAIVAAPAAAAATKPAKAAKADATPDYAPEDKHHEPVKGPAATVAAPAAAAATKPAKAAKADAPAISFFMHDVLGGSAPSERVVAGITANTGIKNLPFSKTIGGVFPPNGGVPLVNNGKINNQPFLTGINGAAASTVISNNGNNNVIAGKNQPFVAVGQLPAAATLQELLFGSIMVIDDEITEGHELGSKVIGKAQGFHLASSLDGSSRTMAFTAIFHNGDKEEDTISFFGVHRTASHESLLAIIGGTGKYEDARGQAKIEIVDLPDQHITDGAETLVHVSVYLH